MERVNLQADGRKNGKSIARRLRENGFIPAVLYGKGREPRSLVVNAREFEKMLKSEAGLNVLFDLSIEGRESVVVRIREYQADPIIRKFSHVDFQEIDMSKKMLVDVPVKLVGKSEGVKEGGVIEVHRRTLSVKCLPTAIPEHIDIEVSELKIGDSIHIDDVKLPEGVECPRDTNFTVISVMAPMKEEEPAPAEEVPVEGVEGEAAPVEGEAKVPAVGQTAARAPEKGVEPKK